MQSFILSTVFAGLAAAAAGPYAQCGGNSWAGDTECQSGYTCMVSNEWYSQCLPGTAATTTAATTTKTAIPSSTTSTAAPTSTGAAGALKWLGINLSVAEFGTGIYPGTWGTEFYFPSEDAIATLMADGYNLFRVAFSMERLVPDKLANDVSANYLKNLTATIDYITDKGAYAILDPHNFGRYYGNIITDTDGFGIFWTKLATAFASNEKVIFDTNNEYHDMDQTLVFELNQVAIDAIRGAGATSQYILAEGNGWSGAHVWNTTNDNLSGLTDSADKLIYEMHQYLDSDNSGTSDMCVSATIGVDRLIGATEWLRENGKIGILGEFAGGANAQCKSAVTGLLDHLMENSDVWQGALWWAAGPWWGDYIYSFEPPSGTGYTYYNDLLKTYAP
ncbi:glycoside hydrolase family 5 protein [Xylaria bambusicola]|uniref:glycoside hydrolase family 5 protein n=1 Tax=Xylaria bambusicola TaxID=326684 RepID=UPI002008175A|nr:glycoside hydrolase family 5 protein [Xylaria bambusicola]KAI0506570.1 glycoside hydrolase family 5 protein [Xylaria bambusicola]